MNNYNNIALFVGLLFSLLSTQLHAGQYGIGLSGRFGDTIIYLPYKLDNQVIIEPYLRYRTLKDEDQFGRREIEDFAAGVGLFNSTDVVERVTMYYGIRAAYAERNQEYYNPPAPSSSFSGDYRSEKLSGYEISPTLGISYNILENLTFDGEVSWYYQDIDGTINDDGITEQGNFETQGTNTRIILRYFFN